MHPWYLAHAWLRGYSDAKLGKPADVQHYDATQYSRGYESGAK